MKKNLNILLISALVFVVLGLLVFNIAKKFETNDTVEEVVTSSIAKQVKKIESENEISYVIEDHDKKLIYSWTFDKNEELAASLKENMMIDIDLGIDIVKSGYNEKIDNINDTVEKLVISFLHHGELPTKATVKLKVDDRYNDGDKLYLYYYNEENNVIEYMGKGIKVINGFVEFNISHCSDYFLTASIVQEAVNNPKNMNIVIIVMALVIIVLIGSTLYQSRKGKK